MNRIQLIKNYYIEKVNSNLPDHAKLGWESRFTQESRFKVLTDNIELNEKKILDVGCGLGNLLEFLINNNINAQYTGIDIMEEMIESAKKKNLSGKFIYMDMFKKNEFKKGEFDTIFSSGIFNINMANNDKFLIKALKSFYSISPENIVINLLHVNSPDRDDTYSYFDPNKVVELIEDAGIKLNDIKIIEGYLANDFTLIMTL